MLSANLLLSCLPSSLTPALERPRSALPSVTLWINEETTLNMVKIISLLVATVGLLAILSVMPSGHAAPMDVPSPKVLPPYLADWIERNVDLIYRLGY